MSTHAVQWFELPATDLERAFRFYHAVLDGKVRKGTFGGAELILFDVPFREGLAVGGSVVCRPDVHPGEAGPLIYLNAFGPLAQAVGKVEAAGGQVLVPFLDLGPFGFAAILRDSEGNKIGLLSNEA